ncbi:MAG TPA: tRNA (adenosine(37)-N6)-threonylcarbamoyltransferase complex ATPase subunit type 1 TsaE [Clostridiaceae bacterium]|jgi:tRNA threonylcarbamoyladenosine biosynthesis protein TsaE|nr:tRNA (adenosine(37)-N6)-threonylcarbamoyltransferase complex ATPase subunit type 1 TsaE [Clostridiaceae bacterium]
MIIQSRHPSETRHLAAVLARALRAGDCLALYGDLGAGKTVFAAAVKEALGVLGEMQSPTFTILRSYVHPAGGPPFHHIDAYRLSDETEWYDLGLDEVAGDDGIALIEWADRIEKALPPNTIRIRIDRPDDSDDENRRSVRITFPEGEPRFADLKF